MEEMLKAQLVTATIVNIFSNAIKDQDFFTVDVDKYLKRSKEIAIKVVESLDEK